MISAVKKLMNLPLLIHPCNTIDGAGDITYQVPFSTKCYVEEKNVVVTNAEGTEIVSHTQLFIDGLEEISSKDAVTWNGKQYGIKAINSYYRNGKKDLMVVYL